jgi:hypothetical protein
MVGSAPYIHTYITVTVTVTVILFKCPKNKRPRGLPHTRSRSRNFILGTNKSTKKRSKSCPDPQLKPDRKRTSRHLACATTFRAPLHAECTCPHTHKHTLPTFHSTVAVIVRLTRSRSRNFILAAIVCVTCRLMITLTLTLTLFLFDQAAFLSVGVINLSMSVSECKRSRSRHSILSSYLHYLSSALLVTSRISIRKHVTRSRSRSR